MAGGCAGGEADSRHSGLYGAGHHDSLGIGGRDRRQGSTVHNLDKLVADGAAAQARQNRVLFPPARNTTTGNSADTGWRLSAGFAAHWLEHFRDHRGS